MSELAHGTADEPARSETAPAVRNPSRRKMMKGAVAGAAAVLPALSLTAPPAAAQECPTPILPESLDDAAHTIRLTIPAPVANNLAALQQSITGLVERLGCRTCFSGIDCSFRIERDFVIREGTVFSKRVDPATISLSRRMSFNLDLVQAAVGQVVAKLGCPACCSGFDILFRQESVFLAVSQGAGPENVDPTKSINVQSFGPIP